MWSEWGFKVPFQQVKKGAWLSPIRSVHMPPSLHGLSLRLRIHLHIRLHAFSHLPLLSLPTAWHRRSIASSCCLSKLLGGIRPPPPPELDVASHYVARASCSVIQRSHIMADHSPKRRKVNEDVPTAVSKQQKEKLKQWFIGSIDQGTTSSRFFIFDGTGTPVASHQMEFKQMYPHSG